MWPCGYHRITKEKTNQMKKVKILLSVLCVALAIAIPLSSHAISAEDRNCINYRDYGCHNLVYRQAVTEVHIKSGNPFLIQVSNGNWVNRQQYCILQDQLFVCVCGKSALRKGVNVGNYFVDTPAKAPKGQVIGIKNK